jgi:hypothetical protein
LLHSLFSTNIEVSLLGNKFQGEKFNKTVKICEVQIADTQRKRLDVVGELVFRQPITEVDNCNIADVLFISQIYNVKLELKLNNETNVEAIFVKLQ